MTMRRSLLPIGLILCIIAGFTAATVIGADVPPQAHVGILEAGNLAGIAGTESVEQIKADPKGKGRDWGVKVFKARNGQTCVAPGRKQGNTVGEVSKDGSIVPYPIEDGGSCTDLSMTPAGVQITSTPSENRTTVHGVAGPKVSQIILTINGEAQELAIGHRGVFFTVLDGLFTPADLKVSAKLNDESEVVLLG